MTGTRAAARAEARAEARAGTAAPVAGPWAWRGWCAEAVRELLGLLLPVACAGCGRPDEAWCATCRAAYARPPWRCEARAGRWDRLDDRPVPVWALADATGPARAVVVAWKDRGRTDLTPVLAALLQDAARQVASELAAGGGARYGDVLVVPVPSTAAARRRRGEHRVGRLVPAVAAGFTAGLTAAGLSGGLSGGLSDDDGADAGDGGRAAVPCAALVRRRGRDQVGLGRDQRARNADAGVALARAGRRAELAGADVVLVDDVLTTGATLAACRRVLEAAGARVVGALVLASTPPPGSARAAVAAGPTSLVVAGRPPPPRPGDA